MPDPAPATDPGSTSGTTPSTAPAQRQYRVDELAERSGTTVRNIRAYQDRGLLPPPRREGRVGLYDDGHLARLTLIAEMLDRGWTLASIGELMDAWQQGQDLGDLVGLGAAITAPWSDEEPFTLTLDELTERFGGDLPTGGIDQADELGVLELTEDGNVVVLRPQLLEAGIALYRAGIPMELVLDHASALRADMDRIAERFVDLAATELFDAVPDPLPPETCRGSPSWCSICDRWPRRPWTPSWPSPWSATSGRGSERGSTGSSVRRRTSPARPDGPA